ncbi:hypothetical protein O6H91_05G102600 [Diphasiastrum complanatum]|uniref:Uncharacterized protein n=3 Tax=Diphasiastrum complanatum TaxID=34168 RepID=A0ACC2DRN6_DIPCM|nr:hypothetical protein O6H91_05G102600 [Diphasiastrum complanatum]KAJ7556871.1 hypothetical protein O6H91_05G102600 [Diphasiastrum complanatum]KAJ7556872.1 hypothetical protein O6H91_05G102600 [Diphasiastrum complanatum]
MAALRDVPSLLAQAELIRESLAKSQIITDNMVEILGSFDHRLSSLETAMRPTQVRTHAFRVAHGNLDKTLKAAEAILTQFDVSRQVENKIIQGPRGDYNGYMAAVDELQRNIEFLSYNRSFKSSDNALDNARSLFSRAMGKLEEEFRQLLIQTSKQVEPARLLEALPNSTKPSGGSQPEMGDLASSNNSPADMTNLKSSHPGSNMEGERKLALTLPVLIAPRMIPQLKEMAQRIVGAGHHQQCVKIYKEIRASSLEQSLRKLGVERLTKEDVQKMQWEVLEGKIGNWIQFMRISIKLLFVAERKICDQIFQQLDPYRERCFAEVAESGFIVLLSSGDAIAKSKKSPEKLFVLLDMYETMCDLLPEIEIIFSGDPSAGIRETASGLTKRLSQTAQETFNDFLEAVEKDATKTPVLDGTVHPLTSYVINYVKFLFDYQATVKQLFEEDENVDKSSSQLATATRKILQVLQNNLDGKSKQYKDPALTQLFLMNNMHYIVRSVRRSEAKDLLGDDWVQRHRRIVQQHATTYQRTAWGKALQYLSGQGLSSSSGGSTGLTGNADSGGMSRAVIKERFKNFNLLFEELHQKQTQWTIPDSELREAVRLAIAEVLLPAYRNFLRRYSSILDNGKNPQKYMKYSPEDLERLLGEFFEGKFKGDQRR